MARLFGAQRMVLQAIQDSPQDPAGFVPDTQVYQRTSIALGDVRDWMETLEGEGLVEVARTEAGLVASITAKGRLELSQFNLPDPLLARESPALVDRKLLNFIYLDKDGIESLWRQLPRRRSSMTPEEKMYEVMGVVLGPDDLQPKSVITVAENCCRAGTQYVIIEDKFNLPQFYGGRLGVNMVNESGYVEFEVGSPKDLEAYQAIDYEPSDAYYKMATLPRVIFSAKLTKFRSYPHGQMGVASHEALFFIGHKGQRVPLGIFGQMSHVIDFYHIKPFAIWR